MELGVAYYPERCSGLQQSIDFRKMKEAGIRTIRIAEFAWSKLEPVKGEFQWEWLDQCIQLADKYGLGVILCTPTACPPIWLVEEYPDVLPVNEKGQKMVFGKRQHRCYHSVNYVSYSERIVTEMAKRYGKRPEIVGWQIDNELGGERQRCYCKNCQQSFQQELRNKYSSIEELNERWGTAFWSETYRSFEQIDVPLELDGQLKLKHNPSLELEFWRFSSKGIVDFCSLQAKWIREHSDALVTTNTDSFAWGDCVNIYELFQTLDIGGMDLYSEDFCEINFYADLIRSVKSSGDFYMMEYGVSSPTMIEELKNLSQVGCRFLSLFKMNPFPWGQEQGYNGLLTMSGMPTRNYTILKEREEKQNAEWKHTECIQQPEVGILYSFDSSWSFSIATWGENQDRWIYAKYILKNVYQGLYNLGTRVGFVFDAAQIKGYRTIIVPRCVIYNMELEAALLTFVEEGGALIVTDDFFIKNQDNVYLVNTPNCYRYFFEVTDNVFLPEAADRQEKTEIRTIKLGKGKVLVLSENAEADTWENAVKESMQN